MVQYGILYKVLAHEWDSLSWSTGLWPMNGTVCHALLGLGPWWPMNGTVCTAFWRVDKINDETFLVHEFILFTNGLGLLTTNIDVLLHDEFLRQAIHVVKTSHSMKFALKLSEIVFFDSQLAIFPTVDSIDSSVMLFLG